MARLVYSTLMSLDGSIADEDGTSTGPQRRGPRVRLDLELVDERRFANGMVYVHERRSSS